MTFHYLTYETCRAPPVDDFLPLEEEDLEDNELELPQQPVPVQPDLPELPAAPVPPPHPHQWIPNPM